MGFQSAQMHSSVVKLVFYINKVARRIFLPSVKSLGAIQRPKKSKNRLRRESKKKKFAHYEAKWDFKEPQIHSVSQKHNFGHS